MAESSTAEHREEEHATAALTNATMFLALGVSSALLSFFVLRKRLDLLAAVPE
jgi:hypothetical protein